MAESHVSIRQRKTAHVTCRRGQVILPGQLQEWLPEICPAIGCEKVAKGHVFLKRSQVQFGWGPERLPFTMDMLAVVVVVVIVHVFCDDARLLLC